MRREISLFGRKWKVVDFIDRNQPRPLRYHDTINRMLVTFKVASYLVAASNALSFALDSAFIAKLFDKQNEDDDQDVSVLNQLLQERRDSIENQVQDIVDTSEAPVTMAKSFFDTFFGENSGRSMLITTITSVLTSLIFGPIVLKLIERYDPNKFDLTKVDMVHALRSSYYAHWAFIEVSKFLLEDVTAISIYYNRNDLHLEIQDVANIIVSLLSGILSCGILCYSLMSFDKKHYRLVAILPVMISIYSAFLGGFTLSGFECPDSQMESDGDGDGVLVVLGETAPPEEESVPLVCRFANPYKTVFTISVILGFFLQYQMFISSCTFGLCPGCCVFWPTPDHGLVRECKLPLSGTVDLSESSHA